MHTCISITMYECVKVKVLVAQSCLCDPKGCSPPGSSICGILQAGILEWIAMPSPADVPNPGIKPGSPTWQAIFYRLSQQGSLFWTRAHSQFSLSWQFCAVVTTDTEAVNTEPLLPREI